jgi:hypothetical protein
MNETWIYHKNQSKQVIGPGKPAPKKAKTVQLAGKVMASVFWDPKGIIFRGEKLLSSNYKTRLEKLKTAIQENAQELPRKNAIPPRQCTCSFQCSCPIKNNRIEVPTSCAPSDFQYFHKTEQNFSWTRDFGRMKR